MKNFQKHLFCLFIVFSSTTLWAGPNARLFSNDSHGLNDPWQTDDVAVFFAMGQSNSVSKSNITDNSPDQVTTPLANVFIARATLPRGSSEYINMNYTSKRMVWSNYTTVDAGNVIGRDTQNNDSTKRVKAANSPAYLAKYWQEKINNGGSGLPPLYIVHIALNSQGISCKLKDNKDWCKTLDKTNTSSLYWLAKALVKRTVDDLYLAGKRPRIIGVDWNQWETDGMTTNPPTDYASDYQTNLTDVIQAMSASAGVELPFWFHKPNATSTFFAYHLETMRSKMQAVVDTDKDRYTQIDPVDQLVPKADGTKDLNELFNPDKVHYTESVQKWMAGQIWAKAQTRQGVIAMPVPNNRFVYDFSTETSGTAPSNMTVNRGSFSVSSRAGQTGGALTANASDRAAATFDNFPASNKYAVTWKQVRSTDASSRSGMTLQAQPNTFYDPENQGRMAGYKFEVSSDGTRPRVIRMDQYNNGWKSAVLCTSTLTTVVAVNQARWYRAVVKSGNQKFYYSDTGSAGPWDLLCASQDTAYSAAGKTQYVDDFTPANVGNFSVDDVIYEDYEFIL
jgi:hypothetical protein